jgi:hypothetical protein
MLNIVGVLPALSAVPLADKPNNSMSSFAGQFASLLEQFLQQAKTGSKLEIGVTSTSDAAVSGTHGFTIQVQEVPGEAAESPVAQTLVLAQPPPQYDPPPAVMVLTRLANAPPSMAPVLRPTLESRLQQLVPRWEPGVAPYISGVDRQYVMDSFRGEAKYWTSLFPDTAMDPAAQDALVQKYSGMVFDWMAQAPASYWGNTDLSGSVLDHLAELPKGSALFTPASLDPRTREIALPVTAVKAG